MGVTVHTKSDSEATSIDVLSPTRRPLYYVQSPSQHDLEKMSYGSSPFWSPNNYHYHCSPIHHSRESSNSRFSATPFKHLPKNPAPWRKIHRGSEDDDQDNEDDVSGSDSYVRFYVLCFFFFFGVLFTIFSLILWAASVSYKPRIFIKSAVFESFNVQAGMDGTGVPTDMLTLNSTVNIFYRNPATFFGVHVTATPLELHYFQLKIASGLMKKFYQSRKSKRIIRVGVLGFQVPLYGGVPVLDGARGHTQIASVPLNLTFVMRSRAYILGRLVKPKFYRSILCEVTLDVNRLGKHVNLTNSCVYQ